MLLYSVHAAWLATPTSCEIEERLKVCVTFISSHLAQLPANPEWLIPKLGLTANLNFDPNHPVSISTGVSYKYNQPVLSSPDVGVQMEYKWLEGIQLPFGNVPPGSLDMGWTTVHTSGKPESSKAYIGVTINLGNR